MRFVEEVTWTERSSVIPHLKHMKLVEVEFLNCQFEADVLTLMCIKRQKGYIVSRH